MALFPLDQYTIGSEILSDFVIVARIGKGQFGEVWKVQEKDTEREFAAKVINLEDNESALKEIRALKLVSKLNHANLVNINTFRVRQTDGSLIPFKEVDSYIKTSRRKLKELIIIMELGDCSLAKRLIQHQDETGSQGGIPPKEMLRYLIGAARGIDYLYAHGQIVHCDIKPANLLIFGQDVKVADCGVAVSVSGGGTQTVSMSPFYSSPELNRQRPGQWTDQYSLAITYYEMRTGELPFNRKLGPLDVMEIHDRGQLIFDSHALKPAEREVLRYATALRSEQRYPTCEAFAEQIDRAFKNLPIHTPDQCPKLTIIPVKSSGPVGNPVPRSGDEQSPSGAITFNKVRRRDDPINSDEIAKLEQESNSEGMETMRPPSADSDTDRESHPVILTPAPKSDPAPKPFQDGGSTLQPTRINIRLEDDDYKDSSGNINIGNISSGISSGSMSGAGGGIDPIGPDTIFGRLYDVTDILGEGNFGRVYRVRDRASGVEYAAKIINLKKHPSSLKEIRGLNNVRDVNSPYVVRIQEAILTNNVGERVPIRGEAHKEADAHIKLNYLFIVMELGSQSLAELHAKLLETGPSNRIPIDRLLHYMECAAQGLDDLYKQKQIVHCDVKPANLLIVGDDVKVADCGISVRIQGQSGNTTTLGSANYSPSELIHQKPGEQTDQYSLAITYFELRTGSLPFPSGLGVVQLLDVHKKNQLNFEARNVGTNERAVLKYATSMLPEHRYPTSADFVEQLRNAVEGMKFLTPAECWKKRGVAPPVVPPKKLLDEPEPPTPFGAQTKSTPRPSMVMPLVMTGALAAIVIAVIILVVTAGPKKTSDVSKKDDPKKVEGDPGETPDPIITPNGKNALTFTALFEKLGDAKTFDEEKIKNVRNAIQLLASSVRDVDIKKKSEVLDELADQLKKHRDAVSLIKTDGKTTDEIKDFYDKVVAAPIRLPAFDDNLSKSIRDEFEGWPAWRDAFQERLSNEIDKKKDTVFQNRITAWKAEKHTSADVLAMIRWQDQSRLPNSRLEKLIPEADLREFHKTLFLSEDLNNGSARKTVYDHYFPLNLKSDSQYALLGTNERTLLATWNHDWDLETLKTGIDVEIKQIKSWSNDELKSFVEKRDKRKADSAQKYKLRHAAVNATLKTETLRTAVCAVIDDWNKNDLGLIQKDLKDRLLKSWPTLESSLALEYFKVAAGKQKIPEQREVHVLFKADSKIDQQFQTNLAVEVKKKLQSSVRKADITNLCQDDAAHGWRDAAIAELDPSSSLRDIDTSHDPSLKSYVEFVKVKRSAAAIEKPKEAVSLLDKLNPPWPTSDEIRKSLDQANQMRSAWEQLRQSLPEFATAERGQMVADRIREAIKLGPMPVDDPFKQMGLNPYETQRSNADLVSELLKTKKSMPGQALSDEEWVHLVLSLHALGQMNRKSDDALPLLKERAISLDVPDGKIRADLACAYLRLRKDLLNDKDAGLPMIRHWLSDANHFRGAKTDDDGTVRTKKRWQSVSDWFNRESSTNSNADKFYKELVRMHLESRAFGDTLIAIKDQGLNDESLPPPERSRSMAMRAYMKMFEYLPNRESTDGLAGWNDLYRLAKNAYEQQPNEIAGIVLGFEDLLKYSLPGTPPPFKNPSPQQFTWSTDERRTSVRTTMPYWHHVVSQAHGWPISRRWQYVAYYAFTWGLEFGKRGHQADATELLTTAYESISQAIAQESKPLSDPQSPLKIYYKDLANITEDLAWLCQFRRADNYRKSIEALRTLSQDAQTNKDSISEPYLRVLLRASSQGVFSDAELSAHLEWVEKENPDTKSERIKIQKQLLKLDRTRGDRETIIRDLVSFIDSSSESASEYGFQALVLTLEKAIAAAPRVILSPDDLKKVNNVLDATRKKLAGDEMIRPQWNYARAMTLLLERKPADAKEELVSAITAFQALEQRGALNQEHPFANRCLCLAVEREDVSFTAAERDRYRRFALELQKRFANHLSEDDLKRHQSIR